MLLAIVGAGAGYPASPHNGPLVLLVYADADEDGTNFPFASTIVTSTDER